MAINDDIKITINLNELVEARAMLLSQYEDYSHAVATGEHLDGEDIDRIAVKLRETVTWDALWFMVDSAILDYMGLKDPNILKRPHPPYHIKYPKLKYLSIQMRFYPHHFYQDTHPYLFYLHSFHTQLRVLL